jgi:hypothetical protein
MSPCVCVGLLMAAAPPAAAGPSGPVLEYRMDEGEGASLRDGAGGREGEVAQPVWVRSKQRAALRFDGRATHVTVQGGEKLQFAEAFSVAVWFRVEHVSRSDPLALVVRDPTFRLLVYPGAGKLLVDIHGRDGQRIYETPPGPVEVQRWHHVALTYAAGGAGATLYLDGAPIFEEKTDVGAPAAAGGPLRIGLGISAEQQRYFKGILANLKLWDRAIAAEEVREIMTDEQSELAGTFRGPDDLVPDTTSTVLHDIGDRKQLFIDERFIEASRGVTLTMNPPVKFGPVILPDRPWETLRVGFCDAVMEYEGSYRLYYSCMARGKGNFVCLATSDDGVTWEKPNLGAVEFEGSTQNNIVMAGQGETVVLIDPHGAPEQRFKAVSLQHWPDPEKCGLYVPTSADGIHWTKPTERVFPLGPDTANQAMWDAQRGKYVAHIRIWNPLRKVGRVEMDDILQPWPFQQLDSPYYIWGKDKIPVPSREVPTCFGYDDRDPLVSDHYNSAAVEYPWAEAAYFMFPSAYLHFPEPPAGKYGNDGLLDIQLAISCDGVKYERLSRDPYVPLSPEPAKDSKCLYTVVGMIRHGDDVYQYYAGYEITHGTPQETAEGPLGSICAARQRLDGFISADADYAGGELLTPPLQFSGNHLELNIDTSAMGACQVGILDQAGEAVPGFAASACDEVHGNHIRQTVTWQGESDLSALAGKTVRLHFVLRACKLYAFHFPD